MRHGLLIGFGVLATVAGVIFTLQGLGYITGSVMTGTTLWTVLGPLITVAGLSMIFLGLRARRRRAGRRRTKFRPPGGTHDC